MKQSTCISVKNFHIHIVQLCIPFNPFISSCMWIVYRHSYLIANIFFPEKPHYTRGPDAIQASYRVKAWLSAVHIYTKCCGDQCPAGSRWKNILIRVDQQFTKLWLRRWWSSVMSYRTVWRIISVFWRHLLLPRAWNTLYILFCSKTLIMTWKIIQCDILSQDLFKCTTGMQCHNLTAPPHHRPEMALWQNNIIISGSIFKHLHSCALQFPLCRCH